MSIKTDISMKTEVSLTINNFIITKFIHKTLYSLTKSSLIKTTNIPQFM